MGKRRFPKFADTFPMRYGPDGEKLCRYCSGPVAKPRTCWCSEQCVRKAMDETHWPSMRRKVYQRDKGRCRLCGLSLKKLERVITEIPYQERAQVAEAIPWLRPYIKRWGDSSLWECDHIVPLVEGGPHTLANLRVLCIDCHKGETAALKYRLAQRRKEKKDGARKTADYRRHVRRSVRRRIRAR